MKKENKEKIIICFDIKYIHTYYNYLKIYIYSFIWYSIGKYIYRIH